MGCGRLSERCSKACALYSMIRTAYPEFCFVDIPPGCLTSGILLRRHSTRMSHIRNSSPPPFHPDISHSALDAGCERPDGKGLMSDRKGGRFNFPGQPYPDHLIAHTRRVSQPHFAQCRGVLLKLPDICDRHFVIFCFRYLMSKSPKSPCNPPIIGFLSY